MYAQLKKKDYFTQKYPYISPWAIEYTNCISAEG